MTTEVMQPIVIVIQVTDVISKFNVNWTTQSLKQIQNPITDNFDVQHSPGSLCNSLLCSHNLVEHGNCCQS